MLTLLLACSPKGSYDLDDTHEVDVAADGSITLWVDGRETFATVGAPEGRTFDEELLASLGVFTFERSGEVAVGAGDLKRAKASGEGQQLAPSLTLTFSQGVLVMTAGEGATHFTFTLDADHDSLAVPVRCDADSTFHGFGEQYNATDQKGEAFPLLVSEQGIGRDGSARQFTGDAHTSYFPMPWYVDARGWGVLVETDRRVEVDLCAGDADVAWLEVVGDETLTWTVLDGPEPLDVVERLGDHVGRPTAPPAWAHGTWMCTQGGDEAVRQQVEAIEAAGIPASVLWIQDWSGRRENPGGGYGVQYRWEMDDSDELFADLPALIDELHDGGYRVVGYMNPFVDAELQHWDEMEAAGMLPLDPETGAVYEFIGPRGSMTTADLSNPDTQDYIRGHLVTALTDVGLDGWMADFAEWLPLDADIHTGDAAAFHNRYPEAWQRISREAITEAGRDDDVLIFARSGWTGVHDVAMVHWIGDQEADWHDTDGLPTVVPAMINSGLSGQPFTTHDIAGFSGGPSGEELYLRWTELGAFSPFMRTHDGNERDDNWRWDMDEETKAHFARFARIHEVLAPELIELAEQAEDAGTPIVRHLMLEFPDDPEVWPLSDQYLLGPDLLVAPMLVEGADEREVYLPEGTWFDVWTGASTDGPGWITASGPIGSPPVFSRGADRTDLRAVE
ncbi:MAG: hypothetical protein GY913_29720 [Proteobacteria bacterium]|nr:hypothetical protein [Pseudomonadota bacterium]MCP4921094.1 hypothetical protein [Pseudomonadota bacterium]